MCVLAWMIYIKFNLCNTVHNKMASQFNIITKNDILGLLTFSNYLGSTHILNAFGRIQMSHFNLD